MSVIALFPVTEARTARPAPEITITRLPVNRAADWQRTIIRTCGRTELGPAVPAFLRSTGLLPRCTFLSSADGAGPLCFRFLSGPTVRFLGPAWARQHLGRPDTDDTHQDLSERIGEQYREAIDGDAPVFNRVVIAGMSPAPLAYTQAVIGWRKRDGRRAVLSCLDA